jgi:ABC-2 type transport system permease protein
MTLLLFTSFIVVLVAALSYLISGVVFGYRGFDVPTLAGFSVSNGSLDTATVYLIPQWQYILMIGGFCWFISIIVATISFMVSVLVRSAAAGMGVMLAMLIAGQILKELASSWSGAKYIFSVNTGITDYLAGQVPAIEGMTLGFSLFILTTWGVGALIVAFSVFTKQDMIG